MSIRTTLIGVILCLGLLVCGFAGYGAFQAHNDQALAQRVGAVYETVNLVIDTSDAWNAESGIAQLALIQTNPISPERKDKIANARKISDEIFERAINSAVRQRDFDGKTQAIEKAKLAQAKLIEIRVRVDEALAKGQDARPADLHDLWKQTVEATIDATQSLKEEIESHSFDNDPIDNLLEIKNFIWNVTKHLGYQSTELADVISRNTALPIDIYGNVRAYTENIETMWEQIDGLTLDEYISPKLKEAYTNVLKEYREVYSKTRDTVVKAGLEKQPYPVTADQWFDQTSVLISKIAAYSDMIGDATAEFAASEESSATSSMLLSLALLCIVFVYGLFAFYVVNNRVIKPVNILRTNINRIKDGDTSCAMEAGRQDEIGLITTALEALRKTVAAAFQQQQMIEDIPIPVIVADPGQNFAVTYTNKANKSNLRQVEASVGSNFAENACKSIDVFFKNPAAQREVLRDVRNLPHSSRIQLGDEWVDLQCSAICDKTGKYTALMTTWNIVTERVRMADNFESSVKGVVDLVSSASGQLKTSAAMMAQNADKTNHSSNIVASASEEASANVQTVASSAEELSNSIQEIARQVAQSTMICNKAVGQAKATNSTIQSLADAAHKIGEVVNLITEIAGKTNLLALNATIEAARAGDAGKGFAVVASEVKDLANQTAKATDEIAGQISAIQNSTTDAVKAIETIGSVIGDLNEIATSIASAVEEQGAATKEIAMNVQQTATGTQEVSSNIINVSRAASETGNAANEVLVSAEELSRQSDVLRNEVDRFLKEIRVA